MDPCEQVQCAELACPGSEPRPVEEGQCCATECLPVQCEQGSVCGLVSCEFGVQQLSEHCCECSAQCAAGTQKCEDLQCGSTVKQEVGDGCCACEPAPACSRDRVLGFWNAVAELVNDEGWDRCRRDRDCVLHEFDSACGTSCPVSIDPRRVENLQNRLERAGQEQCKDCSVAEFSCPEGELVARCQSRRCVFEVVGSESDDGSP